MRHFRVSNFIWLSLWLVGSSCRTPTGGRSESYPSQAAAASRELVRITLVATNDVHGWVSPHEEAAPTGGTFSRGGLAAFSSYVQVLRKENPGGVLLLDAGDMFQGTLVSNLTEGAVVIDVFNQLGYTAVAMGNHEFDYGPEGPVSVALDPKVDPFGALKARIRQARFPILARNVYDAQTGERPSWLPSGGLLWVDVKGVTVGLVGLVTPSTPSVTNPVNVASLQFGSLVPEMEQAARILREKGADVVVALVHAGGGCRSVENPHDLTSCDVATGEIFEALEALPPRTFDAVIAGHTHQAIAHFVRQTPVVQTNGLGRFFSTIDLFVEPRRQSVVAEKTTITPSVPVCVQVDLATQSCDPAVLKNKRASELQWVPANFHGEEIRSDSSVEKTLQPALARVESLGQKKLGLHVPVALTRKYDNESALGSFLADSLRASEKVDVALLNPGGLRADLGPGSVTYGDVFEVLPFDDSLARVTVSGENLEKLLHAAFEGRKGVFAISGLEVSLTMCQGFNRLRSFQFANGKPLREKQRYVVAMSDFLARGGDGLGPVLAGLPPGSIAFGVSKEGNFRDTLISYWQSQKNKELVAPRLGRIRFVEDAAICHTGQETHSSLKFGIHVSEGGARPHAR